MRTIWVYADWEGLEVPHLIGQLNASLTKGQEVLAFEYDETWLRDPQSRQLDPAIGLFAGAQYPRASKPNFGMFLDSSPDRWGRFVQDRREAQLARSEGRTPRKLQSTDYLLGVHDLQRLGGLRFKTDVAGPFLDENSSQTAPPWAELPALERAAHEIEREGPRPGGDYSKWLAMLVAPGGSLGGARPKAGVVDDSGRLWIGKFPGRTDQHDVGRWEYVAHRLATEAGVVTAPALARRFASPHHTFLTRRFDRSETGDRIHFASAMTLFDRDDGDDASNGASYLEIAEFLERQGAEPTADLQQLWRRIVFNVCISNTDDHLRNHGFLLEPRGWRLSPAYDMNPVPLSNGLSLLISEFDNSLDLGLTLEVAPLFRLTNESARVILDKILSVVGNWRSVAMSCGASAKEAEQMEGAFRIVDGLVT